MQSTEMEWAGVEKIQVSHLKEKDVAANLGQA